jgi:hypothetical protein
LLANPIWHSARWRPNNRVRRSRLAGESDVSFGTVVAE